MVAIKAHQAQAFLRAPPQNLTAVLFFGTDPGMVSERSGMMARAVANREQPPGEILRLDDTDLDHEPGRLETELQMRPMFSSRRIVRAIAGRRIAAPLLKPLLADGPLEGFLIVEAGNLKPDEALRALFEKNPACAAVACYPDSDADIESLIIETLAPFSLTLDMDARTLLQSRLGADRALSRAEIEKLALYCAGREKITLDDVEIIVGDAADLALERIAEAAAEGRTKAAISDFGRALASGENSEAIIAITQRYFMKLHRVRGDVDAGQRLDDALKGLRPPLFFKQRDAFARQVRGWQLPQLNMALKRIAETAKTARLSPAHRDVHTERLLLALASIAVAASAAAQRR